MKMSYEEEIKMFLNKGLIKMRRKRNQFTYDPFLPVSEAEAKAALKTAEDFVDKTIERLKKENPQLKLDFS